MTAPATRTATDLDISDCPICRGDCAYEIPGRARAHVCDACLGTGQRHTATSCGECGISLLVLWSVDHTLAAVRCDACAAVCNETAARKAARMG